MGLFDRDRKVENADLECAPQNDYVSEKTVAKIDDVVDAGEKIHFLAPEAGGGIDVEGSGAGGSLFGDNRSRKFGTIGFIRTAATDKRVLVKVPQVLGSDERSIPYRSITSVDLDLGMVYKRLTLQTPGQTYHIDIGGIPKADCREMARFIRQKVAEAADGDTATKQDDPLDQLKRLRDLLDEGVISESEFEEKKADLLDRV